MPQNTIVAMATPPGVSAIAVLRISGSLSAMIFNSIVGTSDISPQVMCHCQYRSVSEELIDDIMAVFFSTPRSYTGEDAMEIYCHGNMLIVEKILQDLFVRGCRLAEPGEFTKRAFLNQKFDLCQAEAVADIIHAGSEQALKVAQKQLEGKLSEQIFSINKQILTILAKTEKEIDFSEDDFSYNNFASDILPILDNISEKLSILIDSNKYRTVIENGIATMIIGAPNAGKTSLFNFLLGEDRGIVSAIAGTTRDIISEKINIGNHILKICDTAGLRNGELCEIEQIGIKKALAAAEKAQLFLIVIDSNSSDLPKIPDALLKNFKPNNTIVIINKIDLDKNCTTEKFLPHLDRVETSLIRERSNLALKEKILTIIERNHEISSVSDVVTNNRHLDILKKIRQNLQHSRELLTGNHGIEVFASDIRSALEILGEITGTYDVDNMLDLVFSQFCIGK